MSLSVLARLKKELAPRSGLRQRLLRRIEFRIAGDVLVDARRALAPTRAQQEAVKQRILARLDVTLPVTILQQIKQLLTPTIAQASIVREHFLARLLPPTPLWQVRLKWVAAVAVVVLLVRVVPWVFIATPTVASSEVRLLPTRGTVQVSVQGAWHPVLDELVVQPGMRFKTGNGEGSFVFHDNGVIRMGPHTILAIHDTAERSEPAGDALATLTLFTGEIWVQGLVPSNVRGFIVSTSHGDVTVNEGSVSIRENSVVDVHVFDRRSVVSREGEEITLVAGERTQMWEGNVPLVKKIADSQYEEHWARQNLARDAVHRREIAQLQQERRAEAAGILPTSPLLYSAKRIAEEVDVLLTLGEGARVRKRLAQANTRLNEAAALLAQDGGDAAATSLTAEYQRILLSLAEGSRDGTLARFLVEQALTESSSGIAAVLPDDDGYLLKQAVLEAGAKVDGSPTTDLIQGMLLADTLDALTESVESGELAGVEEVWGELQPHLVLLKEESELQADVRKEVRALLTRFALLIEGKREQIGFQDSTFLEQVAAYLPPEPPHLVPLLSEEHLSQIVAGIEDRIFLYHMTQPRLNQMVVELKAIRGHPEEGRILRRLYFALPDGPEHFPNRMQREITRLQWEKAGEVL